MKPFESIDEARMYFWGEFLRTGVAAQQSSFLRFTRTGAIQRVTVSYAGTFFGEVIS